MATISVIKTNKKFEGRIRASVNSIVTATHDPKNILHEDDRTEINWSSIGSVPIEDAEEFLEVLKKAIEWAKERRG